MARPRKLTNEQMIQIVDSYYLARADGNEKRMKCSLIAEYAQLLGYSVEAYDFRRNLEVREHIERIKVFAEVSLEVDGKKYTPAPSAYKVLDVEGFIRNNAGAERLAYALRELDAYWQKVFEYTGYAKSRIEGLLKEKASLDTAIQQKDDEISILNAEISEVSTGNNKLTTENRYLRKMLRTYLYPAVADEILRRDNEPPQTDTSITEAASADFISDNMPLSFEASASKDVRIQSDAEQFIAKLWEEI
jgi:regulator of replication initiation timing